METCNFVKCFLNDEKLSILYKPVIKGITIYFKQGSVIGVAI